MAFNLRNRFCLCGSRNVRYYNGGGPIEAIYFTTSEAEDILMNQYLDQRVASNTIQSAKPTAF